MKSNRNHSMVIGDKVFTNMTASEVKKLSAIMNVPAVKEDNNSITVTQYIEKYNPDTRRWQGKAGTEMISVQILHDVIDREEDEMTFPVSGVHRNSLPLK